jgi:hypothetical protein|tara:strand:- start:2707 stop:3591 length:885 start_codon:yes stop_codon:yes gene_type:complete
MTTSSSKNFEIDVAEYIEEAFERCGLELRTGYDLKTAKRSMNLLFADWANRGLNQWTIDQTSITVASGVSEYPAGTLTLSVGASASFTVGETITGGTSAATASITSKPTTTSVATTIPVGTFSNGETITGGTSAATTTVSAVQDLSDVQSTIDILSTVVTRDGTDFAIDRLSRSEFLNIPTKTQTGRPNQFFLDRQITPVLKIWPVPDNSTDILKFNRLTRIEDADAFTNTVDVPFRFYPCLAAGLAYYLSMKKNPQMMTMLKAIYEEEMIRAMEEDRDRASFKISPPTYRYGA